MKITSDFPTTNRFKNNVFLYKNSFDVEWHYEGKKE